MAHAKVGTKAEAWGPSHSFDTNSREQAVEVIQHRAPSASDTQKSNGAGTHTTNTESATSTEVSPTRLSLPVPLFDQTNNKQTMTLERIFESAASAVDSLLQSTRNAVSPSAAEPTPKSRNMFEMFLEESCSSPCTPRQFPDSPPRTKLHDVAEDQEVASMGIVPLVSPSGGIPAERRALSEMSQETPMDRRKKRHTVQTTREVLPVSTLTVEQNDLTRSISELTMKSSHGEATAKLAENRRMAYYAVGKHHKNSGRGGNRRCYFTGKLILGGAPFYAGSVQQGLRTLVVFCLPSAIGLPKEGVGHLFTKQRSDLTGKSSSGSSQGVVALPRVMAADLKGIPELKREATAKGSLASISKTTSADEMSFLEEELDPNWDLDRDYLLQVLPEPGKDLLDEMAVRYPDQFETLPVQVRSPHCWRLFIKFCFFSGLPIAEGEMHYQVLDEIANDVYGEEIILSHEVMEAVNGESAEILRLPNQKTFKYLRKHYTQQSGKLSDRVFQRASWEMQRPEI